MIRSRKAFDSTYCGIRRILVCRRTMAWKSEAETTDAAVASSQLDLLKSPARKTKPKLLFPWVHSPDPPRRLIEREAHFRGNRVFDYKTSCTTISALTARAHLEVPFWKILLGSNSWKEELADNCSWAFCQSVAGILSNTYDGTFCRNDNVLYVAHIQYVGPLGFI